MVLSIFTGTHRCVYIAGTRLLASPRCLSVVCMVVALLFSTAILLPVGDANAQEASKDSHVLNLRNTDIHLLIETVSRRTGKNFIVDPRVKANVTVLSSESMDAEQLYELFLSVLAVHGFAAVPAGSLIKIVPSAVARQSAVPTLDKP